MDMVFGKIVSVHFVFIVAIMATVFCLVMHLPVFSGLPFMPSVLLQFTQLLLIVATNGYETYFSLSVLNAANMCVIRSLAENIYR